MGYILDSIKGLVKEELKKIERQNFIKAAEPAEFNENTKFYAGSVMTMDGFGDMYVGDLLISKVKNNFSTLYNTKVLIAENNGIKVEFLTGIPVKLDDELSDMYKNHEYDRLLHENCVGVKKIEPINKTDAANILSNLKKEDIVDEYIVKIFERSKPNKNFILNEKKKYEEDLLHQSQDPNEVIKQFTKNRY